MTPGGAVDLASPSWTRALVRACRGEGVLANYQPIVDVSRGVVTGYEALARFEGRDASPDVWFAAARAQGCEVELEAAALGVALEARVDLPRAAQFLAGAHADEVIVVLDANRRPCGLLDAEHALVGDLLAVMTVSPATTVAAAARRARTRPPADRFRPLVCADGTGRYLGIVRLERIIDHLARRPEAEAAPAVPAGHRSER